MNGLIIKKRYHNGGWEIIHERSGHGCQGRYKTWDRRWQAEEYRKRLYAIRNVDWTASRDELQTINRAANGNIANQMVAIEKTLTEELQRGQRNGWPIWKTKAEFYRKENA